MKLNNGSLRWLVALLLAVGLFFGGYFTNQTAGPSRPTEMTINQKKSYYISFDDYYYEVPKQKTVDDRLVPGGQFLYNFGVAIKANTLDDLFNDGAIGVQALIPLNSDNQAFERYINETVKPSAENAFKGTVDITFDTRKEDQVRVAEVVSQKDGVIIRRQYIVNLPQSVSVVSKDDGEAFRNIGKSIVQASTRFSDFDSIKLQVMATSFMLKNQMFDDMYRLAHDDLRGATSVDEMKRIAERSKDIFTLETKVSGAMIKNDELTATVHFLDANKPANNKTATLTFRQVGGIWKLFGVKLPNGVVTGATQESPK